MGDAVEVIHGAINRVDDPLGLRWRNCRPRPLRRGLRGWERLRASRRVMRSCERTSRSNLISCASKALTSRGAPKWARRSRRRPRGGNGGFQWRIHDEIRRIERTPIPAGWGQESGRRNQISPPAGESQRDARFARDDFLLLAFFGGFLGRLGGFLRGGLFRGEFFRGELLRSSFLSSRLCLLCCS